MEIASIPTIIIPDPFDAAIESNLQELAAIESHSLPPEIHPIPEEALSPAVDINPLSLPLHPQSYHSASIVLIVPFAYYLTL
ncbi:hypothetical protein [Chamaesiphon sp.]|uniref:hypothetical protein n=1 Tax=Chamaesiphon sp. TaxID=2814140 RepID=UPI003593E64C